MKDWAIEFRIEVSASVARVIICGDWNGDAATVIRLLKDISRQWPAEDKVKYLITCGGFVDFPWPFPPAIGKTRAPRIYPLNNLILQAQKYCDLLLNDTLRLKLRECTRYLTLGVDSMEELDNLRKPHVELVALLDLKENKWHWTGKSYPTTDQEVGLVPIADLQTHFVDLEGEKVMILGCHDLNMFSQRSESKAGEWRREIMRNFQAIAKDKQPTLVLHHPHTTDSPKVWATALWGLRNCLPTFPTLRQFSSAGKWYNEKGPQRSELKKVLEKTRLGNTIDIIIRPS